MEEEQKITLYDADLYEKEEPKEKSLQFVVFRVGGEWYSVEISRVREVMELSKITLLPSSPEYIAGIISLRGNIVSVTDMKKVFGLREAEQAGESKLVVISSGILETALLVDEVAETITVPQAGIDPALVTTAPERAGFIEGEFKSGNRLIGILKVERILNKG